jgi:hypothetical protein
LVCCFVITATPNSNFMSFVVVEIIVHNNFIQQQHYSTNIMQNFSLPIRCYLKEEDAGKLDCHNDNGDHLLPSMVLHNMIFRAITHTNKKKSIAVWPAIVVWWFLYKIYERHDFKRHLWISIISFSKLLEWVYNNFPRFYHKSAYMQHFARISRRV